MMWMMWMGKEDRERFDIRSQRRREKKVGRIVYEPIKLKDCGLLIFKWS